MIIGLDHGYGAIKTANFIITTGITEYEKDHIQARMSLNMHLTT